MIYSVVTMKTKCIHTHILKILIRLAIHVTSKFVYSGTEVRVVMASITKMAAVVCIHLRYALGQIKAVT